MANTKQESEKTPKVHASESQSLANEVPQTESNENAKIESSTPPKSRGLFLFF